MGINNSLSFFVNSIQLRITKKIMVRLAFYFAIALSVASPALGQGGLDLGEVLNVLTERPYKCGQCADAGFLLVEQLCDELTSNFPILKKEVRQACKTVNTEALKFLNVDGLCEPFGLCTDKEYNEQAIKCQQCPKALRQFVVGVCSLLPDALGLGELRSILVLPCKEVARAAFGKGLYGPCQEAGICP